MSKEIEDDEPELIEKKRPGGFICRLEPSNTQWIKQFPRSAKLIQRSGWFNFCDRLQGYHSQLTMAFIENYDDGRVQLQSLTVRVNENSIAEAINVPAEGERWFKQKEFKEDFSEFLVLGNEKLDWKNGVHVNRMKPAWRVPLEVVQNYITCDGRYDRVLKCHLKLLLHMHGVIQLNLPFYLLKSLQKMIFKVQKHPSHTARSIYHQGLIKLLVLTQLEKEGRSWSSLLEELGFSENPKEKGKKMMDDAHQQIINPTEVNQNDKDKAINVVNEPVNPETPCIQEGTEKLSDIFKSIASKKTICKQLFKKDKPRTKMGEISQEGAKEVVVIEDAASEGTINTVEEKHYENMEEFIDMQGVAGAIPEIFCTGEHNKHDAVSNLQSLSEEKDDMKEEDIDVTSELNQCQRSLQIYKEQTKYLQDINEKLLVANKRLREDMEEKEAEFQKLLRVSRNILKEK